MCPCAKGSFKKYRLIREMKKTKILNNEEHSSLEDFETNSLKQGDEEMKVHEGIEDEIRHRKTPQPMEEGRKLIKLLNIFQLFILLE